MEHRDVGAFLPIKKSLTVARHLLYNRARDGSSGFELPYFINLKKKKKSGDIYACRERQGRGGRVTCCIQYSSIWPHVVRINSMCEDGVSETILGFGLIRTVDFGRTVPYRTVAWAPPYLCRGLHQTGAAFPRPFPLDGDHFHSGRPPPRDS